MTAYLSRSYIILSFYLFFKVDAGQLRPVMVWIHGGGFMFGSGNGETDLYGPEYFMDKDIVFVTINYRLGPFGKLHSGSHYPAFKYLFITQ